MLIHVVKTVVIIPARYASTRFPGKPLVLIKGKPMIQHTYERACRSKKADTIYIATDDRRIADCASAFTSNIVMTSTKCKTGTERCAEALNKLKLKNIGYVINVQGDEPFIQPAQIDKVAELLHIHGTHIATLAIKIQNQADLPDPNKVKIVLDSQQCALLFSRSAIPYVRGIDMEHWLQHTTYYKHIGIYGFQAKILSACVKLKPTYAEIAENLEQLRWLQHGYNIKVGLTRTETLGIDTPDDLIKVGSSL